MEKIDKLKAIIEAGKASAEDKQFIIDLSKEYEMPFEPKGKCQNCYIDQAVLLWGKLKKESTPQCSSRLRDDIDVIINGYRINNATLTEEMIEKYRGKELPEHWFV